MMKFIVLELRTNPDGQIGTTITSHDTEDAANVQYHKALQSAYSNTLPSHGVYLLTNDGMTVKSEFHFTPEEPNNEG